MNDRHFKWINSFLISFGLPNESRADTLSLWMVSHQEKLHSPRLWNYIYLVFFIWCQRQIDCLWVVLISPRATTREHGVWFVYHLFAIANNTHAPPFSKAEEELVLPALFSLVILSVNSVMMASFLLRVAEAKAASMCGPRETAAATTTATATAMLQACGPSPSTRPSTTAARPCTTRAAPPPWPPPSATAARGTQKPEWWVLHRAKVPRDWKLQVPFCWN